MVPAIADVAEQKRLNDAREAQIPWKKWGPYLSERQWGTVREDYSDSGDAWNYFTHDQARSRAYKWGEDGLGGLGHRYRPYPTRRVDRIQGRFCAGVSNWNCNATIRRRRASRGPLVR